MLEFVILYLVAYWLFTSWLRLPKPATKRQPYSHHDVILQKSRDLCAYADYILDGGEILDVL